MDENYIQKEDIDKISEILDSIKKDKSDYKIYFLETKIKELENLFLSKRDVYIEQSSEWTAYNRYYIKINNTKERELEWSKDAYSNRYTNKKLSERKQIAYEQSYNKVIDQIKQDLMMLFIKQSDKS